jgi:hypothetical protein
MEAPPIERISSHKLTKLDVMTSAVTIIVLCSVFGFLFYILLGQIGSYQRLLADASAGSAKLALARAADAAIVKTCSIFLAFALMFLGALYTFRVTSTPYRLSAEGDKVKGTLETASPGLVMITIGMVLICSAIWKEYSITLGDAISAGAFPGKPEGATTSSVAPGVRELGFGRKEIASVNTAIALLDGAPLAKPDAARWAELRPELDQFRKTLVFRIYPQMRQTYDALAAKAAFDPKTIGQLSADDQETFESVRRLLSEQVEEKSK